MVINLEERTLKEYGPKLCVLAHLPSQVQDGCNSDALRIQSYTKLAEHQY